MHVARLALIALTASAAASGSVAFAAVAPEPPQQRQLDRTCSATLASIRKVANAAASQQVQTIVTQLDVVTPGDLTATVAFNRSGSSIRVARDESFGVGCAQTVGHGHGLGPGRSRIVSTLHQRFTAPGRYTLTFTLGPVGRKILAQLGAAERAYRTHHPHGHQTPGIACGVRLSYTVSG